MCLILTLISVSYTHLDVYKRQDPKLILADEPTGALDSRSADDLLRLFGEVNEEGQTILMVTHSARAASRAGRVLFIKDEKRILCETGCK